ncbi:MAG: HU family DNA-binding protein [Synechococcaceae cyanobacterium RM1_1_27]|nr:HU family DNA-binding protein [Synechococcaceae cyanobacterium RM1_1_27]
MSDPGPSPSPLNRRLLARQMAQQVDGLTVQLAQAALEAVMESIGCALAQGQDVRLAGFGTFSISQRRARSTRHPRTGQPIAIPAARVPMFSPSPQLRQRMQVPPPLDALSEDIVPEDIVPEDIVPDVGPNPDPAASSPLDSALAENSVFDRTT